MLTHTHTESLCTCESAKLESCSSKKGIVCKVERTQICMDGRPWSMASSAHDHKGHTRTEHRDS